MEDIEKAVPTMAERVKELGITLNSREVDSNPSCTDWPEGSHHYRVTLHYQGRRITTPYSKGPGLRGEAPTATEVLECLALDASGIVNTRNFEDWCDECGDDPDSRKAEETYTAVKRNTAKLEKLLGSPETFDAILYHTEH